MGPARHHTGYTLIELLLALILLGVILATAFPPAMRWRDRAAVLGARDELAAALSRTRVIAVSAAGATLVLEPASGRIRTRTDAGRVTHSAEVGRRYDVRLEAGDADSVTFRYDALGIGRLANRTIRIRRRDAEAGLTVSAYGRFRRW